MIYKHLFPPPCDIYTERGQTQKCRSCFFIPNFARGSGNETEGPRIPSCCIRLQTQSMSSQILFLFSRDVLFMSLSLHSQSSQTGRCLVDGESEKCFSVMQLFWFTSTGGHKQMHSLVSGTHHNEPCAG